METQEYRDFVVTCTEAEGHIELFERRKTIWTELKTILDTLLTDLTNYYKTLHKRLSTKSDAASNLSFTIAWRQYMVDYATKLISATSIGAIETTCDDKHHICTLMAQSCDGVFSNRSPILYIHNQIPL